MMRLEDFELYQLVFEIRYEDAFEIWDRAGQVHRELCRIWPGIKLTETGPNQQLLRSPEVQLQTGIRTSHVMLFSPSTILKREEHIVDTYEVWRSALELTELKRVGTRAIYRRRYASEKEAGKAFIMLGLAKSPEQGMFQHTDPPIGGEVRLQWKSDAVHTMFSAKTQQQTLEVQPLPEFGKAGEKLSRDDLLLDVDRATGKPMSVSQFDANEWLKSFSRFCLKELPRVLA